MRMMTIKIAFYQRITVIVKQTHFHARRDRSSVLSSSSFKIKAGQESRSATHTTTSFYHVAPRSEGMLRGMRETRLLLHNTTFIRIVSPVAHVSPLL